MKPRERIVPKWHDRPYEWNQVGEHPPPGLLGTPLSGLGRLRTGLGGRPESRETRVAKWSFCLGDRLVSPHTQAAPGQCAPSGVSAKRQTPG